MSHPQGLIKYSGLSGVISGEYVNSHGIAPGTALLTTSLRPIGSISEYGTLSLSYARYRRTLSGCRVANVSLSGGGTRLSVRIEDRRWKWRFGQISGCYDDKAPRELAKLLTDAMGESGADLSALPSSGKHYARWDASNPATELQNLCDSYGCRIVLTMQNRLRVVTIGQGRKLPLKSRVNGGYGVSRSERADSILIVGGTTLVQSRLKLKAIGQEKDGSRWDLRELSYAPDPEDPIAAGFGSSLTFTEIEDDEDRAAAQRSVFREFQVESQADGSLKIPKLENLKFGEVSIDTAMAYLLPEKAEREDPDDDDSPRLPAQVHGTFWGGGFAFENVVDGIYPGQFSVDPVTQIVTFSSPVIKLDDDSKPTTPELYLETAYQVVLKNGEIDYRVTYEQSFGQSQGTGPQVIKEPAFVREIIAAYGDSDLTTVGNITDTFDDVQQEMQSLANIQAARWGDQREQLTVKYSGFNDYSPDGLIDQVRFSAGGDGAFTEAGQSVEFVLGAPRALQRKQSEKQKRIDLGNNNEKPERRT